MKLQDLSATQQTKQVSKVMESYFSKGVEFDRLSQNQATSMLKRVRGLINEHRRQPDFHRSETNPAYLQLIMMEKGLRGRLMEAATAAPVAGTATAPAQTPQQQQAMQTAQVQQKKRQIQDQIKLKQKEIQDLQKQMNNPTMVAMAEGNHSLRRKLREASEVQQAQVVLASKDMVDQVQKMIEQTTSIQFKDLPALVDSIKNEIGVEQSAQFNQDASAALSGLVQNLQASKQQLESALNVVTGQAPQVPGAEMGADLGADMGGDLGADAGADLGADLAADLDNLGAPAAEEPEAAGGANLGRGRR